MHLSGSLFSRIFLLAVLTSNTEPCPLFLPVRKTDLVCALISGYKSLKLELTFCLSIKVPAHFIPLPVPLGKSFSLSFFPSFFLHSLLSLPLPFVLSPLIFHPVVYSCYLLKGFLVGDTQKAALVEQSSSYRFVHGLVFPRCISES